MKKVTAIHAVLAVSRPGDITLDTDSHIDRHHGRHLMTPEDEPVEGIPAFINLDGIAVPFVRAHTTEQDLEDLIRLGRASMVHPRAPQRLEVVRFTFRQHVTWIER